MDFGINAAGGQLPAPPSVAASNGIATFSDLAVDKSRLPATPCLPVPRTCRTRTCRCFDNFKVASAAAHHLVITGQPPATAQAGQALSPADHGGGPDGFENLVSTDTSSVTLSLGNNAGGGTLAGDVSEKVVGGVATFTNVSLNKVGTNYTLVASDSTLNQDTSASFSITRPRPASWSSPASPTPPPPARRSAPVVVQVLDQFGNLVTTDTSFVTMALGNGSGSGSSLSGTKTVKAVGGVATFGNLSINKSGNGYSLVRPTAR